MTKRRAVLPATVVAEQEPLSRILLIRSTTVKRTTILKAAALLGPCLLIALLLRGQTFPDASVYANDPAAMIAGYRHVEVSSVSDAIGQATAHGIYIPHTIHTLFH